MVFFHGSGLSYRSDDASLVCDFSVWWECFVETLRKLEEELEYVETDSVYSYRL